MYYGMKNNIKKYILWIFLGVLLVLLLFLVARPKMVETFDAGRPRYAFEKPSNLVSKKAVKWNRKKQLRVSSCGKRVIIPGVPAPYDQGYLGTCVVNAISMAMHFAFKKIQKNLFPSRAWLWIHRKGLRDTDGTKFDDVIEGLRNSGMLYEGQLPYGSLGKKAGIKGFLMNRFSSVKDAMKWTASKMNLAKKQSNMYLGANGFTILKMDTVDDIKASIRDNIPVMISYLVWNDTHPDNGHIQFKKHYTRRQPQKGSHMLLIVGYEDPPCKGTRPVALDRINPKDKNNPRGRFIVLNSWGQPWGNNGLGTFPISAFDGKWTTDDKNGSWKYVLGAYAFRLTDGRNLI
jgi:hypothetical protein